jgi:hypothetical protein
MFLVRASNGMEQRDGERHGPGSGSDEEIISSRQDVLVIVKCPNSVASNQTPHSSRTKYFPLRLALGIKYAFGHPCDDKKMPTIMRAPVDNAVCVYCASNPGTQAEFKEAAECMLRSD